MRQCSRVYYYFLTKCFSRFYWEMYFSNPQLMSEVNIRVLHSYTPLVPHEVWFAASQCNSAITQKTSSSTDMFYIYAEKKLHYRHTSVKVHYIFVFPKNLEAATFTVNAAVVMYTKFFEERRNSKAPDINFSFFFIFTLVCFTHAKHSVVHMYRFICFLKLLVL